MSLCMFMTARGTLSNRSGNYRCNGQLSFFSRIYNTCIHRRATCQNRRLPRQAPPKSDSFIGSQSEPPVRFELTTYALRVRCSTPELRWRTENSAFTSLLVRMQFTKYSYSDKRMHRKNLAQDSCHLQHCKEGNCSTDSIKHLEVISLIPAHITLARFATKQAQDRDNKHWNWD